MKKLSAIIIELAEQVLAQPARLSSNEGRHAALLLAHVAWNLTIDPDEADTLALYREVLAAFERENPNVMADLKSHDCEALIQELMDVKRRKYPRDNRYIHVCGTTPAGNVHVEWTYRRIKQRGTPGAEPGAQRRPEVS